MSLLSFLGLGKSNPKTETEAAIGRPEPAAKLPEDDATVYCDPDSSNARAVFEEAGVHIVETPEEADILWMRKNYVPWMGRLEPFQLLNHLPEESAITDKGYLAEHLKDYDKEQTKFDFGMKDIVRETYCLYLPEDCERFFSQLPAEETKENLWILKPTSSSRGRGIRILWQFEELRNLYANPAKYLFDPKESRYVIQRYIRNPLLLEGRKSEIRIYWLIASLDPLLVLMYREGTVRLNTKPYSMDDFDNTLVHVTNVFQQKAHPDYDPSAVLKWSFSGWEEYLIRDLKVAPPNFVQDHLKPRLKRMLAFVVEAALPSLVQVPESGLFSGLVGADIIFDDTLHPWLTEVQKGPGLSFDDPIKQALIPKMLNEALAIMKEVRLRKREGMSLTKLDAIQGFEWVIRDGEIAPQS